MVIGAGRVEKLPDGLANPAEFDVKRAGKPDPKNVSPLAESAALSIINSAGLGQVGLVEGMGDPRLAYNLPPPSFPAPPAPAQQAGAAGGSDAAGSTKTTTGSGQTYADKAALRKAILSSGVAGVAQLSPEEVLAHIKDSDLKDANGNVSLESIAKRIIERMKEDEQPAEAAEPPPAEPPANASTAAE